MVVGYAQLMGRFALPLFDTQTFVNRSHPENVLKAHRYKVALWNDELHGRNWRRKGVTGVQWVLGIERHKSGYPHSHAVLGHPDLDLGAAEFSALRRIMRLTAEAEWGFCKLEVAKSAEHVNGYVSKYIAKDGEIEFSPQVDCLVGGQLSLCANRFNGLAVTLHDASASPRENRHLTGKYRHGTVRAGTGNGSDYDAGPELEGVDGVRGQSGVCLGETGGR